MRIAIFSDTYVPEINGVARTLKRYTNYLEENGIEYKLFIPEASTSLPEVPHVQRFSSIPFLFYPECRIALPNPLQIKQTLDVFKPTLIHIATPFNLGLYGLRYGKKNNIPMVASYHTNFDDYLDYYRLPFLKKWIWKYMTWFHRPFEKVYVPSIRTREKVISQNLHSHIEVWGRGVDHSYYSPSKITNKIREKFSIKEKNILLYVGRIAPEKDIEIVLETFHNLPDQLKKDTHLLIVGDGPLLKQMTVIQHDKITFTGFIEGEELAEVYASSDVFIFPSSTETFGNVVLEAMASGLPVVVAKAGGVQDLVEHGQNGYLCEAKNTDEFIKNTLVLLENDELRLKLAENARQFALSQSWEQIFNHLLDSFMSIVINKKQFTA